MYLAHTEHSLLTTEICNEVMRTEDIYKVDADVVESFMFWNCALGVLVHLAVVG